jgi:sporadic carbohydrate cluster protein (TIGR04323 family)
MKLKGYIFSRPFFGERVPQHIQNIILRDYCKKKDINFLLSATEYAVDKSTYILFELVKDYRNYNGIVFYSIFQLPFEKKLRHLIYKKTIEKKKELHFACENIVSKTKADFEQIEKIFLIKELSIHKNIQDSKIGQHKNFVTPKHLNTKRDYLQRMNNSKVKCMRIAKKYEYDYWDGDRKYGYGGYKYIYGYHSILAKKIIKDYSLNNNSKVLDLGCGKGFLLYEIKKILSNIKVVGIDVSKYAKSTSKKEISRFIKNKDLKKKINYENNSFDLVISINTLHNLKLEYVAQCLKEIERIGKSKFICVESYRNENEQFNLQCWALTAETIIDVNSWKWLFKNVGYTGDYEFIYFK